MLKEGQSEGKRRSSSVQESSLRKGEDQKEGSDRGCPQANSGNNHTMKVLVSKDISELRKCGFVGWNFRNRTNLSLGWEPIIRHTSKH